MPRYLLISKHTACGLTQCKMENGLRKYYVALESETLFLAYLYTNTSKMKKFYALILLAAGVLFSFQAEAASGIFQTYIVIDTDGPGPNSNSFLAGGINSDLAPTYDGTAFGTVAALVLNGGEVKTYKNSGSDVYGAEIFYSVEAVGTGHSSYTAINLPFDSNIGGAPFEEDQKWQEAAAGIDLVSGLAPGDYELQVFWKATSSDGDHYDSNFSANFTGTFTVAAPAAVPTLGQWGLIIFGLLLLCSGAIVVWRRQYSLQTAKA